jgi:mRNA interferase HigB
VITQKRLRDFWGKHPQARTPLTTWHKRTKAAIWKSFPDVKATFSAADYVAPYVVFDVGGNNYRVIAKVEYRFGKVFIAHVFTHAEYERWTVQE